MHVSHLARFPSATSTIPVGTPRYAGELGTWPLISSILWECIFIRRLDRCFSRCALLAALNRRLSKSDCRFVYAAAKRRVFFRESSRSALHPSSLLSSVSFYVRRNERVNCTASCAGTSAGVISLARRNCGHPCAPSASGWSFFLEVIRQR